MGSFNRKPIRIRNAQAFEAWFFVIVALLAFALFFLIIGLFAFILIMAGSIIKHPAMIFVGIIVLGVVILIAVIFSNIYNNITESDEFSATKAQMPIQDKFMQYLPTIVVIMAILILSAILWSRSQFPTTSF